MLKQTRLATVPRKSGTREDRERCLDNREFNRELKNLGCSGFKRTSNCKAIAAKNSLCKRTRNFLKANREKLAAERNFAGPDCGP